MKRFFLLLIPGFLYLPPGLHAQAGSLQQQINKQVWKPFIEAFNNMDTDGFMKVHSKEVIRVVQDDNFISGYDEYLQSNSRANQRKNIKRVLELRFLQRIARKDKAFEVGYFKATVTAAEKTNNFYGKFHVLLRKEEGVWKILMDADASENTNEALFLSGKPME